MMHPARTTSARACIGTGIGMGLLTVAGLRIAALSDVHPAQGQPLISSIERSSAELCSIAWRVRMSGGEHQTSVVAVHRRLDAHRSELFR